MYLVYVLAAIAIATYFWSWGRERRVGWAVMATAVAAAFAGAGIPFGLGAGIGAAYCAALVCLAIGLLGRTFYDQLYTQQQPSHYPGGPRKNRSRVEADSRAILLGRNRKEGAG